MFPITYINTYITSASFCVSNRLNIFSVFMHTDNALEIMWVSTVGMFCVTYFNSEMNVLVVKHNVLFFWRIEEK